MEFERAAKDFSQTIEMLLDKVQTDWPGRINCSKHGRGDEGQATVYALGSQLRSVMVGT